MYKYKRGINNLEQAKIIEYAMSNNKNICFLTSGILDAKKPYSGLYIKNGKIMVESIAEELKVDGKVYKIAQISTKSNNYSAAEYISSIDLNDGSICYNLDGIILEKKIVLNPDKNMLCIEYMVKNETRNDIKMKITPFLTYRELYMMKNASMLKFNQRHVNDGVIVNLSIINDENLVIKIDSGEYIEEPTIVHDVKHEMLNEKLEKKEYFEDLLLPGYFDVDVFAGNTKKFHLYFNDEDFRVDTINFDEVLSNYFYRKSKAVSNIADEFVELKDLAMLVDNFSFEDSIITTLPYPSIFDYSMTHCYEESIKKFENDLKILIDVVKSIEGQYIVFDKLKEANKLFIKLRKYIREIDSLKLEDIDMIKQVARLKLWYIEQVNRFVQKYPSYMDFHIDFIKEILDLLFENEKLQKIVLSNIELVALSFNAIKVYENLLSRLKRKDTKLSDVSFCIQNLISEKYWSEEDRCMKENIDDKKAVPNVSMIYTLSLSYPCIYGDMNIKLLDTIFRQLYTPYGLRKVQKGVEGSEIIYPEYMAHFVKANLRQNGITMASQKIVFNLVKELIQDIGKYVNGGIKKAYSDKGLIIDSRYGVDLYTNAEIIRLYDMLT